MLLHEWKSPPGHSRVLLNPVCIRELRRLAIQGLMALPRRGIEIGGILFGGSSGSTLRIEGFEEGPCEHRYGPSYALSGSDREKLTELLDARLDNKWGVVGFYRSFTSRDPVIEQADESYIREHFPRGGFLFLMLQPVSLENCAAHVRFFRDGNLLPEGDDLGAVQFDPAAFGTVETAAEVAITSGQTLSIRTPDPMPQATSQPAGSPAERPRQRRRPIWHDTPPLTPPQPETRTREAGGEPVNKQTAGESPPPPTAESAPLLEVSTDFSPRPLAEPGSARPGLRSRSELASAARGEETPSSARAWFRPHWSAVLAAFLVMMMAGVTYYFWSLARQPRWTELHLDAQPDNGQLAITWDAASLRAVGVTRGLLVVSDGPASRTIELDGSQLRGGKYTYGPFEGKAAVRLTVYSQGIGVAGESVRVESTRSSVSAALAAEHTPTRLPSPPPAAPPRIVSHPAPLREVQPTIPAGIRSRIAAQVVIPVDVEVSEHGQVLRATAEQQSADGLHRYLAEQAQKAARRWRFRPARSSTGETVAARQTIRFVFTP